jgi:hypothetical protein
LTGTVSAVSVCSAAKLVVMVRWSIHEETWSIPGMTNAVIEAQRIPL